MRPTKSGTGNAAASNEHAGNSQEFAVEGPLWAAMSANTYDATLLQVQAAMVKYLIVQQQLMSQMYLIFQNSNQVTLEFLIYSSC